MATIMTWITSRAARYAAIVFGALLFLLSIFRAGRKSGQREVIDDLRDQRDETIERMHDVDHPDTDEEYAQRMRDGRF